ncbi:hypothetical protein, partial [Roseiflexus castenholzii]|uniref:hypothetical protein n=1 Tax=Roseiflexus castenholzii TaxID=120962 RepID=UPI003C7CAFDF
MWARIVSAPQRLDRRVGMDVGAPRPTTGGRERAAAPRPTGGRGRGRAPTDGWAWTWARRSASTDGWAWTWARPD